MRLQGRRVLVGAAILGALAVVLFVTRLPRTPARAATSASAAAATVTIDPSVGETFAPAPPSSAPGLSAQQAWTQFAQLNGASDTSMPSTVTVQLGLLTLPVGPGTDNTLSYTAHNELAYGYSWHSCPVSMLSPPSPDNPCIEWLFLDASTGVHIDETWQQ